MHRLTAERMYLEEGHARVPADCVVGPIDPRRRKSYNVRSNPRWVSPQENAGNQRPKATSLSGFKGIHRVSNTEMWEAVISAGGTRRRLGHYATVEEAAVVYDAAAMRLFGDRLPPQQPERRPSPAWLKYGADRLYAGEKPGGRTKTGEPSEPF